MYRCTDVQQGVGRGQEAVINACGEARSSSVRGRRVNGDGRPRAVGTETPARRFTHTHRRSRIQHTPRGKIACVVHLSSNSLALSLSHALTLSRSRLLALFALPLRPLRPLRPPSRSLCVALSSSTGSPSRLVHTSNDSFSLDRFCRDCGSEYCFLFFSSSLSNLINAYLGAAEREAQRKKKRVPS